DDPHAAVHGQPEALLQLAQERLRVAGGRVGHALAAEDEHGEFGQVVAGEVVQFAAGEHLPHRGEAVTVEAGGVPDADHAAFPGFRPGPGGPANACAIGTHSWALAPVMIRCRSSGWLRWVTSRQKSRAGPV